MGNSTEKETSTSGHGEPKDPSTLESSGDNSPVLANNPSFSADREKATPVVDSKEADEIRARYLSEQAETRAAEKPATAYSALWSRKKGPSKQPHDIATQLSVYDDPNLAPYFQPSEKYENRHRFDPAFRWTWSEDKNVVSKIDWRVTAWSCLAFFALDLDRGNISQANTDNLLDDLGLDTNDYNLGQTIFRTCFLLAELPSQLISKKLGPDNWIPMQMIMWSVISGAQFWLSGRTSFLVCRALIGTLQGGFIPDVILYLSYFFTSTELPLRLAVFYMANRMTDVIAPLMAVGLLRLRGVGGYEGWRWLFLIEGIITVAIGVYSWFNMVPSPTQTKAWYRPKGWFSEHEEKVVVNKILRDDPSKSDMHNRQAITPKMLWRSLCDYDLWPVYLIGLTFHMPAAPPDQYLTLTLRALGFDTFNSNLLSIPCQVAHTINMFIITWFSEKLNQRAYMGIVVQFWYLPCLIALAVLPTGASRWASYAIVTVLLSWPYILPLQIAWVSRNCNTVRTRTVSAALLNMLVQLNNVISANIYREDDRPEYRRGNRVLIGVASWNVIGYLLIKTYYVWRNKTRDRIWRGMTDDERRHYMETTTDEGSKRLDFRFVS